MREIIKQTNRKMLNWLLRLTIDDPRTWFGKTFIFASLMSISLTANAGPVVAIVAAVGSALGFAGAAAVIVGAVAIGAAVYAATAFLGFLNIKIPDYKDASEQASGVQVQRRGSVEQIPIVYGHRRVGGVVTFATTGADKNKYLWVVYTFAEGPIEGLRKIYIDDQDLDVDKSEGFVASHLNANMSETDVVNKPLKITWGKYKDRVQLFFSKGRYFTDPTQITINDYIMASDGVFAGVPTEKYKKSMVSNGLVTVWARYEWIAGENNPFSGSIPLVHLELLGKTIQPLWNQANIANPSNAYSVKVTSTETAAYGTGERYSTNPVEILLDYLRNPRYGKGLSVDEIDWDSWYAAAAKCNQMVPTSITGQTQPILRLNPIIQTDSKIMENVKTLLTNFRAYMPYVNGKYRLKIEDAGHPTDILSGVATISRTFTQDNIVGDVSYTGIERSAKYNQVVVQYVEPQEKFTNQSVTYPVTEAERQTYITQDGNREYKFDYTFTGITSRDMAFDMARLLFNKSRYQETCSFTATSEAFDLELGDNIYIQSKILNFTDTPWRIVKITLNADHSVALECVRNPDWIYPHVRAGERDYVLPVYIPKGAERIIPQNVELYPTGIIPPTKASLPSGTTTAPNPVINPSPSNVAVSNNTTTTTAVSSPSLTDVVTNLRVDFALRGVVVAEVVFTPPDIGMYKSSIITLYNSDGTVNAAGIEIPLPTPWTVGNQQNALTYGYLTEGKTYKVVVQVKYSTGQLSTLSSSYTFTVPTSASLGGTPTSTTTTTTPTTTAPVAPPPPKRDNYVQNFRAEVTSTGFNSDPRYFVGYFDGDSVNADAIGVNIYLRSTVETNWRKSTYQPAGFNFYNVSNVLFDLSYWGQATNFEIIVRALYKDGSESTKQRRFTFTIQSPYNTYPYDCWYGKNNLSSTLENTSAFNPTLYASDAVVGGANIAMSIASTRYSGTDGIMITMNPPAAADKAYWYGQTIRYRPIIEGQDPDFTTYLDKTYWTGTTGPGGAIYVTPTIRPIVYNQKYEIVVTPYVSNGVAKTDSLQSWYGAGFLNNSTTSTIYPADDNWNFNFNWRQVETSKALQTINSGFAPPVMGNAVVQLSKFDTVLWNNWYSSSSFDNGTSFNITSYHKITYSAANITNFKQVNIYRRYNSGNYQTLAPSAGGAYALYNGLGRWEKVTSANVSATVHLRGPTSKEEFYGYYQVPGYANNTNLLSKSTVGWDGKITNNHKTQIWPAGSSNQEFLFVVEFLDGSESAKGLLVKTQKTTSSSAQIVNQLAPNLPTEVTVSDYNGLTAGYQRNLNEFRTLLGNVDIGLTYNQPLTTLGTEASITKWVSYPTTNPTDGGAITPAIK